MIGGGFGSDGDGGGLTMRGVFILSSRMSWRGSMKQTQFVFKKSDMGTREVS